MENSNIDDAFSISSVMLIIFVAVFIIYSNGFFVRKRKKEVGLYSLLGIQKKQIGKMLFYENMLIGLISLVIGILLGSLLSKLFLDLLMKIMGLKLNVYFEISPKAIIDTAFIFLVIVLYTSIQGYRLIYKFKLVELFNAEQEGETMPKDSVIIAFISVILIGSGYFLALIFLEFLKRDINFLGAALYIVLSTVIGTYLLFKFFTVFILKRARKKKSVFYRGINMIATSQLLYRIKGNAKSLATIAILSAVTLTSVGTSISIYYNTFIQAKKLTPYSYSYEKNDIELENRVNVILNEEKDFNPVTNKFDIEMVPVKGIFEGEKQDSVGNANFIISEYYYLLSQSLFNSLSKEMGTEKINLRDEEAFVYDDAYVKGYEFSPIYKGNKAVFPIENEMKKLTIKGAEGRSITNLNELIIIVPDKVYEKAKEGNGVRIVENINVKNEINSKSLTEKLKSIMPVGEYLSVQSFNDFYTGFKKQIEVTGLIMFIGIFLGLVFLLATGSVIYFKQITEANIDRVRYSILHKIGVTKKEIKKTIAKQVRFIFIIPLVVGVLHSLFALKSLSNLIPYQILIPQLISIGVYGIIYSLYYFLTVHSYYKIISRK
ncbi:ABC transporter permease [Clostridium sp. AL.422]|uniref:ABC transporter permease n=1 Tax=Clostridium TaxID=1485 RepID=UPI00293DBD95|nr:MULTISPECIES: ABC transporter permease [unclassified Clostridium]MDV4151814.1 ABC transporter permease [Clostridium sp. AL.422]